MDSSPQAGSPLITVMETATLLAKTHIAQAQAQTLKLGADAEIQAPGVSSAIAAKISMISPALDPGSTTVEVWLKIENKSGTLKAGSPVKVLMPGRTVTDAMKIPLAAVMAADDGSKSVMVISDKSEAQRKKINLGITDGTDVQILGGIDSTDNVITGGGYGLDAGTKVKIGAAEKESDDDAGGGGK